MKFSQSLNINLVPEWSDHYIAYSQLKKKIYQIEKDLTHTYNDRDIEEPLLSYTNNDDDSPAIKLFAPMLEKEVERISSFYKEKEIELDNDRQKLFDSIKRLEFDAFTNANGDINDMSPSRHAEHDDEDDDNDPNDNSDSDEDEDEITKQTRQDLELPSASSIHVDPQQYNDHTRHETDIREAHYKAPFSPGHSRAKTAGHPSTRRSFNGNSNEDDVQNDVPRRKSIGVIRRPSLGIFRSRTNDVDDDEVESIWTSRSNYAIDQRIMIKRRLTEVFVQFSELKQYAEINKTGFKKILKKFDKITDNELQSAFMDSVVNVAYPFTDDSRRRIENVLNQFVEVYARVVTLNNRAVAQNQLKAHLREYVVLERNSVWRQMVGQERRSQGVQIQSMYSGDEEKKLPTGIAKYIPSWLTGRLVAFITAVVVFITLTNLNMFDKGEENCLALLVFCVILWSSEAIPLFVTSLSVPLFIVILRVVKYPDGHRMAAEDAAKYILSQMMNPTIFLLIGGFTIAAALSKHGIDRVLAIRILNLAGTNPKLVLLAQMGVACFSAMWISNVAAPVLCYSLSKPLLRKLPPKSPYAKSMIIGIALAANIGGQASPIASPQNVIALDAMDPPLDWLQWFVIALPVASVTLVLIWGLLLLTYGSGKGTVITMLKPSKDRFTYKQWYITIVTITTIILWCVAHSLQGVIGDMGIIAILPLIAFFGTGILSPHDFNSFPWTIVYLAMGGIALGKGVMSSGLLDSADDAVKEMVNGFGVWRILVIFSVLATIVATFISHTIAAVLLVPIATQVGQNLNPPHGRLLIMATALICSAGMGLPVSGFPNIAAINQEDTMGERYLNTNDFLLNGVPATILAAAVVDTLGFLIMKLMGL
ncbi:SPX-domain-containing protein [Wallemia mellicola]|nr:SPX-domain-containing protein [Wallemia mellicola]